MLEVNLRFPQVEQQVENACSIAIRMMMEDIHMLANPVTPKRPAPVGGNLRTSITKQMETPLKGVMRWNVPYAQYQERGMRADKTHVVKRYSTPGTHAHFVEESINKVTPRIADYLRMGGLV